MGIFQEQVEVVVRVPRRLGLRFDGQDMALEPNYNAAGERIEGVINMIPRQCIPYALNQNVRMGTEDPFDPSTFQSLVGIVDRKEKKRKSWHDCTFIDESGDTGIGVMTRVNINDMLEDDPQVKNVVVRGRKTEPGVRLPAIENGATLAPRGRG